MIKVNYFDRSYSEFLVNRRFTLKFNDQLSFLNLQSLYFMKCNLTSYNYLPGELDLYFTTGQ